MLAQSLHIIKVNDHNENHRSKPYEETACGIGVRIALHPQTFPAEMLPIYIIESGRLLVPVNSRGSDCQQMGELIPEIRHGGSSEQTRTRSQAHHGFFRYQESDRNNSERQTERKKGQETMAASNRQRGE